MKNYLEILDTMSPLMFNLSNSKWRHINRDKRAAYLAILDLKDLLRRRNNYYLIKYFEYEELL